MMASPTAASAAATAITKNTNTWPPMPRLCASATNVRFTALSISSTHMKITMTLRRNSTPATPSVKSTAEIARAGLSSMLQLPLREHDGADDRREQQYAGDLERNEVGIEQGGDQQSHRPLDVGRSGPSQVQQHDHEEEQHHDRAGIDQHLEHRDELRVEQHEQRGEREQGDDQPQRAGDRVPARDAQQRAQHRDDAEKPEKGQGAKWQRGYSPLGSEGSHSVETGCVCAVRRSRS